MPSLFDPLNVGELLLPNRVLMAPLTRSRAGYRGGASGYTDYPTLDGAETDAAAEGARAHAAS